MATIDLGLSSFGDITTELAQAYKKKGSFMYLRISKAQWDENLFEILWGFLVVFREFVTICVFKTIISWIPNILFVYFLSIFSR